MAYHALSSLRRAVMLMVCGIVMSHGANAFEGRHVLVIGIDGCRADALLSADAPHLHKLIANGVVTYQAFAGGEKGGVTEQATSSGPGWSSILTGVWRNKHGVSDNTFSGDAYDLFPHFFQRLKEVEPNAYLSSIVSWNPIDEAIVEPVDEFTDFRGKGNGNSEIARDRSVRDMAVAHVGSADPDVLFLHFDQVDGAGHSGGYGAHIASYLRAIAGVDALIGEVLEAIENRPNRDQEKWQVIVTTDHGGIGTGHGGQSADERTIFFITSGDETPHIVSEAQPGHTAVPATVLTYLDIPIDEAWGWEEPAFGLPPYLPANLQVTKGLDRDLVLNWSPGIDLEADQLVLKRNGLVIAELPLESTHYVDTLPPVFVALQIVYTLEVAGSTQALSSLQLEVALPQSLEDTLVLHWPLDGDESVMTSGDLPVTVGAFGGQALQFGSGMLATELTTSLSFDRFTHFSLGLWIRSTSASEGVIIANKPTGRSDREGWILSLTQDGGLRWNLGDGVRQVTLRSATGIVTGGDWHHVGVAVERLQSARLFLDGQPMGSAIIEDLRSSDGPGPLALGGDSLGLAKLAAELDDLRIWRRALTESDWQALYEERAIASQWRASEFTFEERFDPKVGLWNADPDGDGRSNLEEFALGSDPRLADHALPLSFIHDDGVPVLILTQRTGGYGDPIGSYHIAGTQAVLEMSDDLAAGHWQTAAAQGAISETHYRADGTHRLHWHPHLDTRQRYFRIRYSLVTDPR